MRASILSSLSCLLWLAAALSGCSVPPQLRYHVEVDPVIPAVGSYYIDPIDSSVVWGHEGLQVKIRFFDDEMLDAEFDPKVSPYTLTGWTDPKKGYTPPLWTAFEVTVINRTRERVELDPTQVVLRLDDGNHYYCRQGVGAYQEYPHYFDYSYLKWGSREGNVHYYAAYDRNQIWERSQYLREKPVRKGRKYTGMLTFPPLPMETRSFTLEVNNFILAFDRFEAGYGNPVEFMDLAFRFGVTQGVEVVAQEADSRAGGVR